MPPDKTNRNANMGSSVICKRFHLHHLHLEEVLVYTVLISWHHHSICMAQPEALREVYPKTWLSISESLPCEEDYNNDGKLRLICTIAEKNFDFDQLPIETVTLIVQCKGSELNVTSLNSLYRLEEITFDMCSNLQLDDNIFQSTPEVRKLFIKATYEIDDFSRLLKVISSLTELQFLSLSKSSGFKRLQRKDLELLKATSLEELDVSSCQIEAVDRDAFEDLLKLKSFDFSSNPLSVAAVRNITVSLKDRRLDKLALKHLYRIKEDLPLSSLLPLKQSLIQHLDLSDNTITRLPAKSFAYAHLKTLNLSNSKVRYISPSAFEGAFLLENMDLKGNCLAFIDNQLHPATNLRVINLSTQNLEEKGDQHFKIAENGLSNLTNLEVLFVNEAPFRGNITRFMFHGLVNLEKLELRKSDIGNIADFAFETMETLRILDLSFNSIKELSTNVFYGLENLTKLDLKWNYLTLERSDRDLSSTYSPSPFVNLRSLQVLDLEKNSIRQLHPDILNPLTELQFLSVKHNMLKSWEVAVFPRRSAIQELLLNHNEIETVSNVMLQEFSSLRKLEVLELSDNPFNCEDCALYAFHKWAKETTFRNRQNFDTYECDTPTEYKGTRINSILFSKLCEPTTAIPGTPETPKVFKEHNNTHILWSVPLGIILFAFGLSALISYVIGVRKYKRVTDSTNPEASLHF